MFQDLTGNLLVLQFGQPSAASNAALAGVVSEALNHEDHVEEIFGALDGFQGLLNEELIDLAAESQQTIRGLKNSCGAALGTSFSRFIRPNSMERALQVIEAHNIRYCVIIGDAEAIALTQELSAAAEQKGYAFAAVAIPSSADNSLPITDHCLGYGTLIKNWACSLRSIAAVMESLPKQNQVVLVEVAGRNTGWAAASTALSRRKNETEDAPHLIYLPENRFSTEKFFEDVRRILEKKGWCMATISEGLTDANGDYLAGSPEEGTSVADMLARLLKEELGVTAQVVRPGLAEAATSTVVSATDVSEALLAGEAAVKAVIEGKSARMITLSRTEADHYGCEAGLAPLSEMGTTPKVFPAAWIGEDGCSLNYPFIKYALPLIQGELVAAFEHGNLRIARLDKRRILKKLNTQTQAVTA